MAPTFAAKAAAGASLLHHLELLTPVILMFYLAALPSLADSLPIQRKFMPDDRDFQSFSEATAQKLTLDCVGANHHHHQRVLQLMLPQWYEQILKYQTEKVIGKSAESHGNHANVVAERRKKTSKRKRKKECRVELLIKNKFKLIKERRKRTSDVYVNSVDNLNLSKIRNKEKIWENFKYNLSGDRNNSFNHEDHNHEIVFLNEAENFTSTTPSHLDKETVGGNSEFCFFIVFEILKWRNFCGYFFYFFDFCEEYLFYMVA